MFLESESNFSEFLWPLMSVIPPGASPGEPKEREGEAQDFHNSPGGITAGYSVPVPCGYATPSGVPLITPTYTTPVIIRHLSVDEDGKIEPSGGGKPWKNAFLNDYLDQ